MKIYCTSDTHLGHLTLINGEKVTTKRPEDFTERILKNTARMQGDLLIHCGDFCIGNDEYWHKLYMEAAKGFTRKVLVLGNHDKKSHGWYLKHGWDFVCEGFISEFFGKRIVFSHVPVEKTDHSVFNIHGHMHGNNHRDGDLASAYDPAWHKDLAPEIHNYQLVQLESLVNRQK